MPEGPEVMCQSTQLSSLLCSRILKRIDVNSLSRYFSKKIELEKFKELNEKLQFKTYVFEKVIYKNKKIIFYLSSDTHDEIYLVSFLGMSGKWMVSPGKHSGISFITSHPLSSKEETLFFDDPRHFGSLGIYYDIESVLSIFKNFGKDFLTDEITLCEFSKVITLEKLKEKSIAEFLISQKYFSGIGNYIRSDCLYLSEVHPLKKLGELTKKEIERVYYSIYAILMKSLECNGYSLRDYSSIKGEKGSYEPLVYNRKFDVTGNPILKIRVKDRSVYYCPNLQKI